MFFLISLGFQICSHFEWKRLLLFSARAALVYFYVKVVSIQRAPERAGMFHPAKRLRGSLPQLQQWRSASSQGGPKQTGFWNQPAATGGAPGNQAGQGSSPPPSSSRPPQPSQNQPQPQQTQGQSTGGQRPPPYQPTNTGRIPQEGVNNSGISNPRANAGTNIPGSLPGQPQGGAQPGGYQQPQRATPRTPGPQGGRADWKSAPTGPTELKIIARDSQGVQSPPSGGAGSSRGPYSGPGEQQGGSGVNRSGPAPAARVAAAANGALPGAGAPAPANVSAPGAPSEPPPPSGTGPGAVRAPPATTSGTAPTVPSGQAPPGGFSAGAPQTAAVNGVSTPAPPQGQPPPGGANLGGRATPVVPSGVPPVVPATPRVRGVSGEDPTGEQKKAFGLRDQLNSKGIQLPKYQPGQYNALACPKCGGGTTKERSLNVNIGEGGSTASWLCHRGTCNFSGSINSGSSASPGEHPLAQLAVTLNPYLRDKRCRYLRLDLLLAWLAFVVEDN